MGGAVRSDLYWILWSHEPIGLMCNLIDQQDKCIISLSPSDSLLPPFLDHFFFGQPYLRRGGGICLGHPLYHSMAKRINMQILNIKNGNLFTRLYSTPVIFPLLINSPFVQETLFHARDIGLSYICILSLFLTRILVGLFIMSLSNLIFLPYALK